MDKGGKLINIGSHLTTQFLPPLSTLWAKSQIFEEKYFSSSKVSLITHGAMIKGEVAELVSIPSHYDIRTVTIKVEIMSQE